MEDFPANEPNSGETEGSTYRIAAVSKESGVPIATVRMWERRYGVVSPARSSGNGRLYSRQDIERLSLLKLAVDAGHAIGTVANLSDEQIKARLDSSGSVTKPSSPSSPCRTVILGPLLAHRLNKAWADRKDVEIASVLDSFDTENDSIESARPDALIVEVALVHAATLLQLRQLRAALRPTVMIVIYGFGTQQTLKRLDDEGMLAIGAPADPAHLARICHLGLSMNGPGRLSIESMLMRSIGPRKFDDHFLATAARQPTSVQCECPNHLADLLVKLNAFELYSRDCESTNPSDAAVHVLLHAAAAHCREVIEHAMSKVLAHEGITIERA